MRVFQIKNSRGAILVLMALCLVVLLGAVGLAIDGGLAYGVRAKLNAATDAAAIAGARATSQGTNKGAQRKAAKEAAEKFFKANFPDGYLGATPLKHISTKVDFNAGEITVTVRASAEMPTKFMGVMGHDKLNISSESEVVRKDLDMAFVLDVTGSLNPVAAQVRKSAETFLGKFNEISDRVALVRFAYGAEVDFPIDSTRGFDKEEIINKVSTSSFNGYTNFAEGFRVAKGQLNGIAQDDRSSLRIIVFFTDGAPNTFSSTFTLSGTPVAGSIRSGEGTTGDLAGFYAHDRLSAKVSGHCCADPTDTQLPPYYNPPGVTGDEFEIITNSPRQVGSTVTYQNVGRIARNLPEAMATQARQDEIYVFTLGMGPNLQTGTGPDSERGEDILIRMANDRRMLTEPSWDHLKDDFQPLPQTGGQYCFAANSAELDSCYSQLVSAILRLTQ